MPRFVETPIVRWYDSGQHAPWVFAALFVGLWTTFQVVSYAPLGLHADMLEAFIWSQALAAGYKHPPLTALIVRAWFSVFPVADWSFHLLAMTNSAVGLLFTALIARRYLTGDKRLVVLLLLLLTPFYQFHGQRFSTNQVLLSTWPIATYCFLRAFETRGIAWSVLAGAVAALAMLGKYYSGFLVAGFVVAALTHPSRFTYLKSPSPWVSTVAALIVSAPHLYWLLTRGPRTIEYAYAVHGGSGWSELLRSLVEYTGGGVGYVSLVFLAYLVLVRPSRQLIKSTLWPADPARRMLVILLAVPLLLPLLFSIVAHIKLTSLWTMSAWFLLPIVLLAPLEAKVSRAGAVLLAALVLGISLATMLLAPLVAWWRFVDSPVTFDRTHAAVAGEVTTIWRRTAGVPLRLVTGDVWFANATAFYSPDHPHLWVPGEAPASDERSRREGVAAICALADTECVSRSQRWLVNGAIVREEFDHAAAFMGRQKPPVRFVVMMVLPLKP